MTVWVLVMSIGYASSITVPSITTEAECLRLGKEMALTWKGKMYDLTYNCFAYERVK